MLQERGAWAQKYIGDAVMAVWLHENDRLDSQELIVIPDALFRLSQIAAGLQGRFGLSSSVRLGAGINTGWASVGNVGSAAVSDHTASGEIVNRAFRIETATKELGCDLAIGEGTFELLSRNQSVEKYFRSCVVKLKGYDEPAPVYAASLASLEALLLESP
jgi:adenylate cyclase